MSLLSRGFEHLRVDPDGRGQRLGFGLFVDEALLRTGSTRVGLRSALLNQAVITIGDGVTSVGRFTDADETPFLVQALASMSAGLSAAAWDLAEAISPWWRRIA